MKTSKANIALNIELSTAIALSETGYSVHCYTREEATIIVFSCRTFRIDFKEAGQVRISEMEYNDDDILTPSHIAYTIDGQGLARRVVESLHDYAKGQHVDRFLRRILEKMD